MNPIYFTAGACSRQKACFDWQILKFSNSRMPYMWNALPCEIKSESNVATFKKKLKSFFFNRLQKVFDPDDIRTFKIICCKCRKSNTLRRCCC